MGKSRIEKLGLGDKVRAFSLAGLSNEDILKRMNTEHSELHISASALSRFLTKNPLLNREDELAVAEAKERVVSTVVDSLESVRVALQETIAEIVSFLEEHKADPRDAATFLRLKLEALDKMAKMLGAYAPNTRVNLGVGFVVPKVGDQRCADCPYKNQFDEVRIIWDRPPQEPSR
jgi:hypothetical protein